MRIDQHVLKAIDDFTIGNKDSALMNACLAIDPTARNLFGIKKAGAKDYKACIRQYWWLIEPFMGGGINLEETKWTHVKIDDGYGKTITSPDLADIMYHVFRCNHAHGEEVPKNYQLLPVSDGKSNWFLGFEGDGLIYMPERIIWALLGVAVFSKGNAKIKSEGDYFLSWGSESLSIPVMNFTIKDWWGGEDAVKAMLATQPHIRVKLEGL